LVKNKLVLASDKDIERRRFFRTILVDINVLYFQGWVHQSQKFWCLFLVVEEVPDLDLVFRRDHELVILDIQQHDSYGVGLELEEELFRDEVVLVDDPIHGNEEEVAMWLTAHLHKIYVRFFR